MATKAMPTTSTAARLFQPPKIGGLPRAASRLAQSQQYEIESKEQATYKHAGKPRGAGQGARGTGPPRDAEDWGQDLLSGR